MHGRNRHPDKEGSKHLTLGKFRYVCVNVAYMKKHYLLYFLFFMAAAQAQVIDFPDVVLKIALLNSCQDPTADACTPLDVNEDGEIDMAEAAAVGHLSIDSEGITSLEGIQHFTNLETLTASSNQLAQLPSGMPASLKRMFLYSNQFTSIDLSGMPQLTELALSGNPLGATPDFTALTSLKTLDLSSCGLTGIGFDGLSSLEHLDISFNALSAVDFSPLVSLKHLVSYDNPLASLNIGTLADLEYVSVTHAGITTVDVTALTHLKTLLLVDTPLTALDVSENTALTDLTLHTTQIASIDLCGTAVRRFTCSNNPNLTYISTRNGASSMAVNSNMPSVGASFATPPVPFHLFSMNDNPALTSVCYDIEEEPAILHALSENMPLAMSDDCPCSAPALGLDTAGTEALSAYPNPAEDRLSVRIPATMPGSVINIHNTLGQLVQRHPVSGTGETTLDISSLASGLHLLTVSGPSGSRTVRFVRK